MSQDGAQLTDVLFPSIGNASGIDHVGFISDVLSHITSSAGDAISAANPLPLIDDVAKGASKTSRKYMNDIGRSFTDFPIDPLDDAKHLMQNKTWNVFTNPEDNTHLGEYTRKTVSPLIKWELSYGLTDEQREDMELGSELLARRITELEGHVSMLHAKEQELDGAIEKANALLEQHRSCVVRSSEYGPVFPEKAAIRIHAKSIPLDEIKAKANEPFGLQDHLLWDKIWYAPENVRDSAIKIATASSNT